MLFLGLACLIIEKDFEGSLEGKEMSTRGCSPDFSSCCCLQRPLSPEAPGREWDCSGCHPPLPHESSDTSSCLCFVCLQGWPWGWGEQGWALKLVGEPPPCHNHSNNHLLHTRKAAQGLKGGTKPVPRMTLCQHKGPRAQAIAARKRWVPASKNWCNPSTGFRQERMWPRIQLFYF